MFDGLRKFWRDFFGDLNTAREFGQPTAYPEDGTPLFPPRVVFCDEMRDKDRRTMQAIGQFLSELSEHPYIGNDEPEETSY